MPEPVLRILYNKMRQTLKRIMRKAAGLAFGDSWFTWIKGTIAKKVKPIIVKKLYGHCPVETKAGLIGHTSCSVEKPEVGADGQDYRRTGISQTLHRQPRSHTTKTSN